MECSIVMCVLLAFFSGHHNLILIVSSVLDGVSKCVFSLPDLHLSENKTLLYLSAFNSSTPSETSKTGETVSFQMCICSKYFHD